jgi:hypothetical protein
MVYQCKYLRNLLYSQELLRFQSRQDESKEKNDINIKIIPFHFLKRYSKFSYLCGGFFFHASRIEQGTFALTNQRFIPLKSSCLYKI